MTAIIYFTGFAFAIAALFTNAWVVAAVAAAYYLLNDPVSRWITDSFGWYVYFATVQYAMAVFLATLGHEVLFYAVVACMVGATVTILSSKAAVLDGFFYRTYNYWWALTYSFTAVPIMFYVMMNLR